MEFERVAFAIKNNGTWTHTSVWRRSGQALLPEDVVSMRVPVGNGNGNGNGDGNGAPVCWFEVAVQRNGSLETIGRRIMYFGRLIDESVMSASCPLRTTPPPSASDRKRGAASRRQAVVDEAVGGPGTVPPADAGKSGQPRGPRGRSGSGRAGGPRPGHSAPRGESR